MPTTLSLPLPLDEALTQEAQREGVSATEHATLLLYLAHALVSEGRPTPFKEAVRVFLARHSLNPDHLGSVLEELVSLCLAEEKSEPSPSLHQAFDVLAPRELRLLTQWRSALVHGMEAGPEATPTPLPRVTPHPADRGDAGTPRGPERDPELVARVRSIRGRFARPPGAGWASEELHREREKDKAREERLVQERGA